MSYILLDFKCPHCGKTFESLEDRADNVTKLPHCGTWAPRVLSPVLGRMSTAVTATRGKNDKPPPLSTAALADGMPRKEWDNARAKVTRAARVAEIKSKI